MIIYLRIGWVLKFLNFSQTAQLNSQLKIFNKIIFRNFNQIGRTIWQINLIQRGWPGYTEWICMVGQVLFRILCDGVISSTAIAGEGHRNPTRTVHPFHGWIFQFRGIFVARVGQFEWTKEAVDPGENWPSLSAPSPFPPSLYRTNNSGTRMKISRPTIHAMADPRGRHG